jgi:hypothetical protein
MNPTTRTALAIVVLSFAAVSPPAAAAQGCPSDAGPDIIAGDLSGFANYTSFDGLEALSFGTTSCNVGDAALDVIAGTNDHEVVGQGLYRLKDHGGWWAMEQVGMSWLLHGFCALGTSVCCSNCAPTDCTSIGVGCSDPHSPSINGSQSLLGPRWQVDAHTGAFAFPFANPPFFGSAARRLQVGLADLEPTAGSTTRYFGEVHYVSPDDAAAGNGDNNASFREIQVSGGGSAWTFGPFVGPTERERPAVEAWRDADPGVTLTSIRVPGEGLLVLASRVTVLGAGRWHYEYALYNMNSHESVRSFSIPVSEATDVTHVGFHDVAYHDGDGEGSVDFDGTDWPALQQGGALTWSTDAFSTNPSANALRWGTTYNFRLDADRPPAMGDLTLVTFRSETVFVVPGADVPAAGLGVAYCDASDGALALCPCGNPGAPDTGCDIAQGTGGVRLEATAFDPDGAGGGSATFTGTGFPPASAPTVVLIRSASRAVPPVVFGDGLRCIGVPIVRVRSGFTVAGAVNLGLTHGAGSGAYGYQAWFRNVPMGFCDPSAAFNLSSAYELVW